MFYTKWTNIVQYTSKRKSYKTNLIAQFFFIVFEVFDFKIYRAFLYGNPDKLQKNLILVQ